MDSKVNEFEKFKIKNYMELHDYEKNIFKIPGKQDVTNGGR